MWFLGKLSPVIFILITNQGNDPWELIKESRYTEARKVISDKLLGAKKEALPELYYLWSLVSENPDSTYRYLNMIMDVCINCKYYYLANLELSKIDYVYGDYLAAIDRLSKTMARCMDAELRSQALFWTGLSQLEISNDQGIQTLKQVSKNYPQTRWATRAKSIIGVSNRSYSVQTGAFKTQRFALNLKERLEKHGFNVSITEKRIAGETFYRVLLTGFECLEDGLRLVDSLKTLGFPGAKVVGY